MTFRTVHLTYRTRVSRNNGSRETLFETTPKRQGEKTNKQKNIEKGNEEKNGISRLLSKSEERSECVKRTYMRNKHTSSEMVTSSQPEEPVF